MVKQMVCIVCPNGCALSVEEREGEIAVTGNKCPKGVEYAKEELTNPKRTLTSTVATVFPERPVLPVRLTGAIPKGEIGNAMAQINKIVVERKLCCGDVIAKDFMAQGIDLIATDDLAIS